MKKLKKIHLTAPVTESVEETAVTPISEEATAEPLFPEIATWLKKMKAKVKPFPWKGINAKNAIVAGCLVLIAVAGYLNIRYGGVSEVPVDNPEIDEVGELSESEDYFASVQIDRERAR
ncbi:MAG: hypothetical protein IKT50_03345 [Clostridia bacterium]|nr:hypothetical protein [Clostridia bacterium]